MRLMATTFFALLILAAPALATDPDILINGGTMDFNYAVIPGGPNNVFGSSGSLVADPPDQGTAATTYQLDGKFYATVIGAVEDGANFIDGGVVVVSDTSPITVGTYPINAVDGFFVFVDDAVGWVPPADLWNTNWTLELMSIVASGKYGAITGSVTFTDVSASRIAGTFFATAIDPATSTTIAVTSGEFNVETSTATEPATWGETKAQYR